MRSLAQCLPILPFPGYAAPKTHAAWPVWSDSTTKDKKFQPLPKKGQNERNALLVRISLHRNEYRKKY